MYTNDIDVLSKLAQKKSRNSKENPGKYMVRAMITGFYVIVAIILSYTAGAILFENYYEFSKIMVSATFSFALALIVFLSGELFTGNNLVMSVGLYQKKVTMKDVGRVWLYSYIGNFIGSVIVAFIFVKSGASLGVIKPYIAYVIENKIYLSVLELILRGMLCNSIVCLGYLTGIKMETEIGKLVMMFFCVFAFIVAGFEHSVANMGVFSIGYFALGGLPMWLVLRNLFWVTIGNIIGGGVFLAIPSVYISIDG